VNHPQRRAVVVRRDPVEVVDRPIEPADRRPTEGVEGLIVGNTIAQQPIA
jgi:hypothetical protein